MDYIQFSFGKLVKELHFESTYMKNESDLEEAKKRPRGRENRGKFCLNSAPPNPLSISYIRLNPQSHSSPLPPPPPSLSLLSLCFYPIVSFRIWVSYSQSSCLWIPWITCLSLLSFSSCLLSSPCYLNFSFNFHQWSRRDQTSRQR